MAPRNSTLCYQVRVTYLYLTILHFGRIAYPQQLGLLRVIDIVTVTYFRRFPPLSTINRYVVSIANMIKPQRGCH